MRIKGCIDEDFSNYKEPSMFILTSFCSFKCDIEYGAGCCQNSSLAHAEPIRVDDNELIQKYINNPITKAIVFGGLEPLDQLAEVWNFIQTFRHDYKRDDTIVIYTGYDEDEISSLTKSMITDLGNIVVKYGRYVPYQEKHFDEVLGVYLASPNQYAKEYK